MRSVKDIIIGFLLILLGFAVTSYSLIAGGVLAAAGLSAVVIFALPKKTQQPQAEQPAQAPQNEQPQAEEPRTPFQTPVQHPEFRQAQQQTGFGEVPPMSQKPMRVRWSHSSRKKAATAIWMWELIISWRVACCMEVSTKAFFWNRPLSCRR